MTPGDEGLSAFCVIGSLFLNAWPETAVPGVTSVSLTEAKAELPVFVKRYHAAAILIQLAGENPGSVVALVSGVYGVPTRYRDIDIWTDLTGPEKK